MRFYEIKPGFVINVGLVKYVEKLEEDKYMVTMMDDNTFYIPGYKYNTLIGENELKCITAVEGFVAHFNTKEEGEFTMPVHCFGVFENGDVKPLDLGVDTTEPMNELGGFVGVSKNGEELVHG